MPTSFDVYSAPLQKLLLIEASAGTGKTWNICGLYLRLLLERDYAVREILVVTFTKSATAELKERIRDRLLSLERALAGNADLALDNGSFEANYAAQRWAGAEARQTALARLRRAISEFDEAAIFTIHGFCQRALSDLPFAAGLPFSLAAIEDDRHYVRRAAADFFRRRVVHGAADADADALYHLRTQLLPENMERRLRQCLAKPLSRLEFCKQGSYADFQGYVRLYRQARALWMQGPDAIVGTLLDGLKGLDGRTFQAGRVAAARDCWNDFFALPLARFLDGDKDWADKCKYLRGDLLAAKANAKAPRPAHPFFDLAAALWERKDAAKAGLQLRYLEYLEEFLQAYPATVRLSKRVQRAVGYDDMLFNLYSALHDPQLPWLPENLRKRYPAALVDEFQDTDPLQLEIFKRIYTPAEEGGCLVLVGDPKQAIYRFRNADLEAYLGAVELVAGQRWSLLTNQRSVPGLLAGVNALFGRHPQAFFLPRLEYQQLTSGARAQAQPRLLDADGSSAPLQIWWLPNDETGELLSKTQAEAWVVQATVAEVKRLLAQARLGDARLHPGQIALLVRTNRQGRELRNALAAIGIGAVERSQASVYETGEAVAMLALLAALTEPASERALARVLVSGLFGVDGTTLAEGLQDSAWVAEWVERFVGYRDICLQHGFARLWRQVLYDGGLAERLLQPADGKRRLTNFLQLAELLQVAWDRYRNLGAVQRYLLDAISNAELGGEESQLRLESDADLVQIVTIHAAKGLEYDIVFCPFLWSRSEPRAVAEQVEFHDSEHRNVLAYGTVPEAARRAEQIESFAEELRLIYVAVTRAVQRVYLAAGVVSSQKDGGRSSRLSPLNWLIAGSACSPDSWSTEQAPSVAEIRGQWQEWAAAQADNVALVTPLQSTAAPLRSAAQSTLNYRAEQTTRHLVWTWRSASFTSLTAGSRSDLSVRVASAADHDQGVYATLPLQPPEPLPGPVMTALAGADPLDFPRGRAAGVLIHAVFEHADFTQPAGWDMAIERALSSNLLEIAAAGLPAESLRAMLRTCLAEVTSANLDGAGMCLRDIPMHDRLNELEFCLPAVSVQIEALCLRLRAAGLGIPRLDPWTLRGYLRGAVDCLYRYAGRFYVIDWKSNHLGTAAGNYAPAALAAVMAEEGYELQYALYTLAVHRYLRARLPEYDYERDFGGCYYLFVRGIRGAWAAQEPRAGIYAQRLAAPVVTAMDELFNGIAA